MPDKTPQQLDLFAGVGEITPRPREKSSQGEQTAIPTFAPLPNLASRVKIGSGRADNGAAHRGIRIASDLHEAGLWDGTGEIWFYDIYQMHPDLSLGKVTLADLNISHPRDGETHVKLPVDKAEKPEPQPSPRWTPRIGEYVRLGGADGKLAVVTTLGESFGYVQIVDNRLVIPQSFTSMTQIEQPPYARVRVELGIAPLEKMYLRRSTSAATHDGGEHPVWRDGETMLDTGTAVEFVEAFQQGTRLWAEVKFRGGPVVLAPDALTRTSPHTCENCDVAYYPSSLDREYALNYCDVCYAARETLEANDAALITDTLAESTNRTDTPSVEQPQAKNITAADTVVQLDDKDGEQRTVRVGDRVELVDGRIGEITGMKPKWGETTGVDQICFTAPHPNKPTNVTVWMKVKTLGDKLKRVLPEELPPTTQADDDTLSGEYRAALRAIWLRKPSVPSMPIAMRDRLIRHGYIEQLDDNVYLLKGKAWRELDLPFPARNGFANGDKVKIWTPAGVVQGILRGFTMTELNMNTLALVETTGADRWQWFVLALLDRDDAPQPETPQDDPEPEQAADDVAEAEPSSDLAVAPDDKPVADEDDTEAEAPDKEITGITVTPVQVRGDILWSIRTAAAAGDAIKPLPLSTITPGGLRRIPQEACGELTGSISGNVWCYGWAVHNGVCVYLNMGGPRVAVEAIRARFSKGDSVNVVPMAENRPIKTLSPRAKAEYTAYSQNMGASKFASTILVHRTLADPDYALDDWTYIIHTDQATSRAKLLDHVTKLVKVPVFSEWQDVLWYTGHHAQLVRDTESDGGVQVWAVSLDEQAWTEVITGSLGEGALTLQPA